MDLLLSPNAQLHRGSDGLRSQLTLDAYTLKNSDDPNLQETSERALKDLFLLQEINDGIGAIDSIASVMRCRSADEPMLDRLLAQVAIQSSDFYMAARLLERASRLGDLNSTTLFGILQILGYSATPRDENCALERAAMRGSVEARLKLVELLINHHDYARTIRELIGLYQETQSSIFLMEVADLLAYFEKNDLALKLSLFSSMKGFQRSLKRAIALKEDGQAARKFLKIIGIQESGKENYFNKQNKATFQLPNIPLFTPRDPLGKSKQSPWRVEPNPHEELPPPRMLLLQSSSPTFKLIKAFELATENTDVRNLSLLQALMIDESISSISELSLWRQKCMSQRRQDLVPAGFIADLLGDIDFSMKMFMKASELGSEVACVMVGIKKFYRGETESASTYFTRCFNSPEAFLHLAIITCDQYFTRQAHSLMLEKENIAECYEWMGDVFFEGITFPKNREACEFWYGIALNEREDKGLDTKGIIRKLSNLVDSF